MLGMFNNIAKKKKEVTPNFQQEAMHLNAKKVESWLFHSLLSLPLLLDSYHKDFSKIKSDELVLVLFNGFPSPPESKPSSQ